MKHFLKRTIVFGAAVMLLSVFAFAGCSAESDHTHSVKRIAKSEATCIAQGCNAHYECDECGLLFADSAAKQPLTEQEVIREIAPDQHVKLEKRYKSKATCTKTGAKQDYYECTGCKKIYLDNAGKKEAVRSEIVIEKTAHSLQYFAAEEATKATSAKQERWGCDLCGTFFSDADGKTETSLEELCTPTLMEFTDVRVTKEESTSRILRKTETGTEEIPLIEENRFVLRVFMGFDTEKTDLESKKFGVKLNLDRSFNGMWFGIGLYYTKVSGLYARVQSDGESPVAYFDSKLNADSIAGGNELQADFFEQKGLYMIFVREGGKISVYGETKSGERFFLLQISDFGEKFLCKMTLGVNTGFLASEDYPAIITNGKMLIGTINPNAKF